MEALGNSLFMDVVPESWAKRAYPSLYGLSQWYADMLQRVKELESWTGDFQLPAAVWLAGFFNPQSFLTAIMQQVHRCRLEMPLIAPFLAAVDLAFFTNCCLVHLTDKQVSNLVHFSLKM